MANAPFNEAPVLTSINDIVNSSSIETTTFDRFRQGVSVRSPRDFFDGTLPRFNYICDDLVVEVNSFGNPKQYVEGVPYADIPGYTLDLFADEPQSPFYPAEIDVSLRDPAINDGIIEPFELRDNIARKSVFERSPTGPHGLLEGGNTDSYGDADKVVYEKEASVLNPFEDSQETFGLGLPGFTTPTRRVIEAFDDASVDVQSSIFVNNDVGIDMANTLSALYVNASGTFVGDGIGIYHPGFFHDLNGFGSDYAAHKNARLKQETTRSMPTMESLAFGDKQQYARRGFIQQIDSTVPSRPLISRTNDERRRGNAISQFNDNKTMLFTASVDIDVSRGLANNYYTYLYNLAPNSVRASGSVKQYPFVGQLSYDVFGGASNPSINTSGSIRPGIGDNWLIRRPLTTELASYTAFDESRLYNDPAQTYYLTQSSTPIEYAGRAADKTQIVIELLASPKSVYFSTGSSAFNVESGLVYYNKTHLRWESVATSSVDYLSSLAVDRAASALAFMPSDMTTQYASASHLQSGRITTDAGFPFATKFDATGSTMISMSDYIQHPFALERCVVTAELSFSPVLGLTATMAPRVQQFFIMNQFDASRSDVTVNLAGTGATSGIATHTVNKIKDVVGIGSISCIDSAWTQDTIDVHTRNLTIPITEPIAKAGHGGTYVIPVDVGVQPIIGTNDQDPVLCAHQRFVRDAVRNVAPTDRAAEKNIFGGAQNTLLSSPRSLTKQVPHWVSSTLVPIIASITESIPTSPVLDSTYLLMPSDNLVFGFANQSVSVSSVYDDVLIANESVSIGDCRVRLIGNLIRDEKQFHFGLNQQLNAESVFEIIGDDSGLDQHNLHPITLYSGTYIDDIIEGTFTDGNRQVIASHVSVQGCRSASLGHTVRLVDADEYLYDSLLPNPVKYHEANGAAISPVGATLGAIFVGIPGDSYSNPVVDNVWARAFPFEPRYSALQRLFNVASTGAKASNGRNVTFVYLTGSIDTLPSPPAAGPFGRTLAVIESDTGKTTFSKSLVRNAVYRFYFGTGTRSKYEMPDGKLRAPGTNWALRPRQRGTKYGIANVEPTKSIMHFRVDTFGQFRDMLEQRIYTRMFDGDANQLLGAAVETIFSGTISQSSNISMNATSSLPYFDDVSRN